MSSLEPKQLGGRLERRINDFCKQIANFRPITSICICGDFAQTVFSGSRMLLEVLVVVDGFKPRLMSYVKFFDDRPAIFYAVDKWVFEKDVDLGFLGEAFAVHLIFPYTPLVNAEYLWMEETKLKRRFILELLENLVLGFPELSHDIHIKPEYFVHEAMLSRARLFPPLYYTLSHFFQGETREQNLSRVLRGYLCALEELEKEGVVKRVDGFYKVSKNFIEEVKGRKASFTNLLRSAQKTLFMSFLRTFPKVLGILSESVDLFLSLQPFESERGGFRKESCIEDPKTYLFLPTTNGLVSLAVQMGIEDFARKILGVREDKSVTVEALGGVLNDVYLVRVSVNGGEHRVVVKSFKDWSGFKWFPLTLWTFGTRTFALLGRSRLERECSTNQFLYSTGFAVPRLLGINHRERLVFMEYVEGETLDRVVRRILSQEDTGNIEKELNVIRKVGEIFAKVHTLDIALGDTKPENILVGRDGKIYLMDFEQASQKGDKAWDVAEFLYFVGRCVSPIVGTKHVEAAVKAFVEGYVGAGGSLETVKAAGKPKYTRVFGVLVFPHIILAISRSLSGLNVTS